jgi:hypothetical protein
MKKSYSLQVGEDIIPFELVHLNEDGTPKNERIANKIFTYENNPTIVDITSMTEVPSNGDIYDPTLEGFPFVRNTVKPVENFEGYGKFVFVINNIVQFMWACDRSTEQGYKMTAVLSSNPKFLEPEIIE